MNVDNGSTVPPVGSIIRLPGQFRTADERYTTFMGLPSDFHDASKHDIVKVRHGSHALVVKNDTLADMSFGMRCVVIMYVKDINDVWQFIMLYHTNVVNWHDYAVFVPRQTVA